MKYKNANNNTNVNYQFIIKFQRREIPMKIVVHTHILFDDKMFRTIKLSQRCSKEKQKKTMLEFALRRPVYRAISRVGSNKSLKLCRSNLS